MEPLAMCHSPERRGHRCVRAGLLTFALLVGGPLLGVGRAARAQDSARQRTPETVESIVNMSAMAADSFRQLRYEVTVFATPPGDRRLGGSARCRPPP